MKRPEQQIQRAVIEHIRLRGSPDVLWWHTPNGGARSKVEGAILKSLGVLPGVADLLFLKGGKFYSLELKADRGRATSDQMCWLALVNEYGGFAAIANGVDEAIKVLETWGLLRVVKSGNK